MASATKHQRASGSDITVEYKLKDASNLQALLGPFDGHVDVISNELDVQIENHGDTIIIAGENATKAQYVLSQLETKLSKGQEIDVEVIKNELASEQFRVSARISPDQTGNDNKLTTIKVGNKSIQARNPGQSAYLDELGKKDLVFGVGPAGTGKTFLAVAVAAAALKAGEVDSIILTRPAVEAGENIGFLPGDLNEKLDPYMRPLYDALAEFFSVKEIERLREENKIEIAPLAFMRGRTLKNAFVVLDEAQNATVAQMKMFITRFGEHSKYAITGDPDQTDLPPGVTSGLADAIRRFKSDGDIGIVTFDAQDVVRHRIVRKAIEAYSLNDNDLELTEAPDAGLNRTLGQ